MPMDVYSTMLYDMVDDTMGKHNLYWPVPNEDIKKNTGRQMRQNFGYDGYDPNITMWENWEDAVADEDKTE